MKDFGKQRYFIVRNKSGADFNAADTVTFNNNPFNLHPCGKVDLRQSKSLPCLTDTVTRNVLFSVVVIDFHIDTPDKLKIRFFLDFSMNQMYYCVKHQNQNIEER